jgi:hypothetical protein
VVTAIERNSAVRGTLDRRHPRPVHDWRLRAFRQLIREYTTLPTHLRENTWVWFANDETTGAMVVLQQT